MERSRACRTPSLTVPTRQTDLRKQPGRWTVSAIVVLLLAFSSATLTPPAWSQTDAPAKEETPGGTPPGAGLQAASWILTIPYGAAKIVFAILGGVTGGLTYVFSGGNLEAAKTVWTTSVYGTYIITPEQLRGEKPVRFLGTAEGASAPPPPPATETK